MLLKILGITSSIIFLIGDLPYIRDSLKGPTKPQRVTWGIVFLLNSIGTANQAASGATNSLWLFGAATLATGIIFIISLFNGVGGHSRRDLYAVGGALAGLALWILLDSPAASVLISAFIGFISLLPTFAKAKTHPETETKITWLLGAISAAMAAVSVGELKWQLLLLPVNATLLQAYMTYLLYFRGKQLR